MSRSKRYGKGNLSGRRTVDYFELIETLEEAQKQLGFQSFAEFARQIAREYLQTKGKLAIGE